MKQVASQESEKLQNQIAESLYFGTIMQCVSIGVIIINEEQQILLVNPFVTTLFGYTKEELTGNKIEMLIPPRFREMHDHHHNNYFKNPESRPMGFNSHIYALRKDNTEFPAEISLGYFKQDKINFTIAFINDITNRQQVERQLQVNEGYVKLLIEHAPAAIAILDTQMRYVMISDRWLEDYGLKDKDLIGKSHYELFPEIPERWKILHRRCIAGEEFKADEEYFPRANGRSDWLKWEMCPWYKSATEIGGIIIFSEVITKRKEAELKLLELNKNLENKIEEKTKELTEMLDKEKELSDLKSKFVTIASHEFRTPLSTILSSAYLIGKYEHTEDQPKRLKHLERVVSSVNTLTEILNDFLSVGKIEEGKINPKFAEFDIENFIKEAIKEIESIRKKDQHIVYEHAGHNMFYLDQSLLKHIVINILSNAIKFSPENSNIHIYTENTNSFFILIVSDSGLGISKEDQEHLSERFFRGANVNAIQGTGLGLHIVYKYTELMNGTIKCISQLGKGTEFILHFKKTGK